jgi:hypothetical protein
MDDRGIGVPFPAGTINFSLLHNFQTGAGDYPAFYKRGVVSLRVKWQVRTHVHTSIKYGG